jgi:hypothetical protein
MTFPEVIDLELRHEPTGNPAGKIELYRAASA